LLALAQALLPQQRVDRQPPSMPDLASTLRAEAGPRKGGKGGKASSKGGRRGKGKEIVLVAPPEERVERFRPPAPLPPEEEDPRVPESLEKLAAGDYTATKWILVQPRGTKRDYSRREVLGQEKVDALMAKYRAVKTQIPLGRRGASEQLKHAIQLQWRTAEVAKLRIHDDRSARDANLPRYNLVLRELEALTGGVVLDASGMSIWLYR
jgi:RNA-binding protein YhbY